MTSLTSTGSKSEGRNIILEPNVFIAAFQSPLSAITYVHVHVHVCVQSLVCWNDRTAGVHLGMAPRGAKASRKTFWGGGGGGELHIVIILKD